MKIETNAFAYNHWRTTTERKKNNDSNKTSNRRVKSIMSILVCTPLILTMVRCHKVCRNYPHQAFHTWTLTISNILSLHLFLFDLYCLSFYLYIVIYIFYGQIVPWRYFRVINYIRLIVFLAPVNSVSGSSLPCIIAMNSQISPNV